MPSLTILAMIHPNGRMWSNTGRIRFTRTGSILKNSLSPQKICGIVATCLTMLLPLRAICPSSIRLIQRWRPISWRFRHTGLKSLILMLGDWTWPMKSTINSGEISARLSWLRNQTSISSGKSGIRPNLGLMVMSSMPWWITPSLRVSRIISYGGIRRPSASFGRSIASPCTTGSRSLRLCSTSWTRMIQSESWRLPKANFSPSSLPSPSSICNGERHVSIMERS